MTDDIRGDGLKIQWIRITPISLITDLRPERIHVEDPKVREFKDFDYIIQKNWSLGTHGLETHEVMVDWYIIGLVGQQRYNELCKVLGFRNPFIIAFNEIYARFLHDDVKTIERFEQLMSCDFFQRLLIFVMNETVKKSSTYVEWAKQCGIDVLIKYREDMEPTVVLFTRAGGLFLNFYEEGCADELIKHTNEIMTKEIKKETLWDIFQYYEFFAAQIKEHLRGSVRSWFPELFLYLSNYIYTSWKATSKTPSINDVLLALNTFITFKREHTTMVPFTFDAKQSVGYIPKDEFQAVFQRLIPMALDARRELQQTYLPNGACLTDNDVEEIQDALEDHAA